MPQSQVSLVLEFQELAYGRCRAYLTDEDGNVLLDQIYKNKNSAQASVRTRLKKEGLGDALITRVQPGQEEPEEEEQDERDEAPEPEEQPEGEQVAPAAPASGAQRWLVKLRHEAQKALAEAVTLRQKADRLEVEHKRLTAAADLLEGPEDGYRQED